MAITPKQKRFIEFIDAFRRQNGFAPSQSEIAQHFGFRSLGTVQRYLTRLREQGLLESVPAHARRGLAVQAPRMTSPVKESNPSITLPLLGRVAAGQPIEAIERPDPIEIPPSLLKRGEHFVLQVAGNSMTEDGVLDGDFVVIKKQKTAERGQMIVALVDNAATLKRFYPKKDSIELHPAHPWFQPIIVQPHQSFQIEGIVTGVIRKVN